MKIKPIDHNYYYDKLYNVIIKITHEPLFDLSITHYGAYVKSQDSVGLEISGYKVYSSAYVILPWEFTNDRFCDLGPNFQLSELSKALYGLEDAGDDIQTN